MSATLLVFSMMIVLMPIIQIQITNVKDIHYRYMIERSLKAATIAAYEKDDLKTSFDTFKKEFLLRCPQKFTYKVKLKNFENYPKLVHYAIFAESDEGFIYEFEESIIEEDKNGNR